MLCAQLQSLSDRHEIECPARVLRREHEITLPKRMAQEFCALVNIAARNAMWDSSQWAIWSLFCDEYLSTDDFYAYVTHEVFGPEGLGTMQLALKVQYGGQGALLRGEGENPIRAIVSALGWSPEILHCEIHSETLFAPTRSVAFAEISLPERTAFFGIGMHEHTTAATIIAVLSAVNRALRRGALDDSMRMAASQD